MNKDSWLKFFMDAGIPYKDAFGYATKFAHNRIQIDMLADLNKEYLKEMDITILGDVIAILRHAKEVSQSDQDTDSLDNYNSNSSADSCKNKKIIETNIKIEPVSDKPSSKSGASIKPAPTSNNTSKTSGSTSSLQPNISPKRKSSNKDNESNKKQCTDTSRSKLTSASTVNEQIVIQDTGYIVVRTNKSDDKQKRSSSNQNDKSRSNSKSEKSKLTSSSSGSNMKPNSDIGGSVVASSSSTSQKTDSNNRNNKDDSDGADQKKKTLNERFNGSDANINSNNSNKCTNGSDCESSDGSISSDNNDSNDEDYNTDSNDDAEKVSSVSDNDNPDADNDEDDDDDDDDDDEDDEDNIQVVIDDSPYYPSFGMHGYNMQYQRMENKYKPQQKDLTKRKVFERLDDVSNYSVSSTTSMGDEEELPITNASRETSPDDNDKNSIFARLGDKAEGLSSESELKTTVIRTEVVPIEEESDTTTRVVTFYDRSSTSTITAPPRGGVRSVINTEKKKSFKSTLLQSSRRTEGILANPDNEKRVSLKDRLGFNSIRKMKTAPSRPERHYPYHGDDYSRRFRTYMDSEESSTIIKKKVKFGNVSEKIIPNKEEAIRRGELPTMPETDARERQSVFQRLGFNRGYR